MPVTATRFFGLFLKICEDKWDKICLGFFCFKKIILFLVWSLNFEEISENEVKFYFKGEPNPELPLIIGYQLPIFSKKDWKGKDFSKTTLVPPLGSGPYLISDVKAGRSLTLKKTKITGVIN